MDCRHWLSIALTAAALISFAAGPRSATADDAILLAVDDVTIHTSPKRKQGNALPPSLALRASVDLNREQDSPASGVQWLTDYAGAMDLAERQGRMLLVYFYDSEDQQPNRDFESATLGAKSVQEGLAGYVCAKLPCSAKIRAGGKELKVLDHAAFAELKGKPGFVMLDFAHKGAEYYGCAVTAYSLAEESCSVRQMMAILELPPGRPEARREAYLARLRDCECPGKQRASVATSPDTKPKDDAPEVRWMSDYAEATALAESQKKMLLIYFCDGGADDACTRFKAETLDHPAVRRELQHYVCLQLPLDATIRSGGEKVTLLEHGAFREMVGKPGVAIVDFRDADKKDLFGTVVSVFPITGRLWYTPERMAVILDLPPGTLTQRTLIYAVRTHPDHPASTDGELSSDLAGEAESHSQYQADLRVQGHHHWDSRFRRIIARLPGGLTAKEVCAESWPGENLVEAAVECVRCWRTSDGHWSAVRAPQRLFGYDMKRGANGVWYATGIFGVR